MPARARTSGLARVMSRPSNSIRPARGRNRPMTLLSSVVLPTPLRPIRQTTCDGLTSRSTSRRIRLSPYATDNFSMRSIVLFPVLPEVDFDHLGIALHLRHRALAEHPPFVQHRYFHGDLPHECHVMIDHQQRVLLGHRHEQFAGAL